MCERKEQAAVLFISGQSNAHAHGRTMDEQDKVVKPYENVFTLDRNPNQSFDITDVVWSGFTTEGKNLGETQDHTYSFAYYFAKRWQNAIDCGKKLPNLHIVQISIGGQGIINGMWNPDKEKVLTPGKLDFADISLFPLALQVNQLVMSNLKRNGKEPFVLGWHWIGSEQDIREGGFDRPDFEERYDYFFDKMLESIGEPCPVYFYKIYLEYFCKKQKISDAGIEVVNKELYRQSKRLPNVTIVETEKSPYWDIEDEHFGVFAPDDAHYLAKVQEWFAEQFYIDVHKQFGREE
ncbi:MAG: hypothetical protein IJZ53_01705 [Tyzzerella sp.]|nr:hypothetical protein [Tyzzerella sp.]